MKPAGLDVKLPAGPQRSQDEETVLVRHNGRMEELRLHEYARIFSIPGLYEMVVHDMLDCRSPEQVTAMMADEWSRLGRAPGDLRVLDVGAGNGVVGELLAKKGVGCLVALDNISEARSAAERDRPGVYSDYLTADLTDLEPGDVERLTGYGLNALTCVAALGFGDIPAAAFAQALNLTADGSLIAFTINEEFLEPEADGGFAGFIHDLEDDGLLEIRQRERFRHRRAVSGESLHYVAVVGLKEGPVPIPEIEA